MNVFYVQAQSGVPSNGLWVIWWRKSTSAQPTVKNCLEQCSAGLYQPPPNLQSRTAWNNAVQVCINLRPTYNQELPGTMQCRFVSTSAQPTIKNCLEQCSAGSYQPPLNLQSRTVWNSAVQVRVLMKPIKKLKKSPFQGLSSAYMSRCDLFALAVPRKPVYWTGYLCACQMPSGDGPADHHTKGRRESTLCIWLDMTPYTGACVGDPHQFAL